MPGFLLSRRRALRKKGRTFTLSRPNDASPPAPLIVLGYLALFRPNQVQPPVTQGDAQLEILNDEILAAGWPQPGNGTYATIDGVAWSVLGANPHYDGPALIGWGLWVRGGQP
jgi:hypothetical protein